MISERRNVVNYGDFIYVTMQSYIFLKTEMKSSDLMFLRLVKIV
jgi:hypothetical protein